MEYLDVYDEDGNYLRQEERSVVHKEALWHKTVHCWLYDRDGNVYFQIRKDNKKLYTTASGHVLAKESVIDAFGREIKEEIGIDVVYQEAHFVQMIPFQLDREDGFRDRAFAHVYVCLYEGNGVDFQFDPEELLGVARVKAQEVLALFKKEVGSIDATLIQSGNHKNQIQQQEILFPDFLVNKGETALLKYGDVLEKIIELTQ